MESPGSDLAERSKERSMGKSCRLAPENNVARVLPKVGSIVQAFDLKASRSM